MPRVPDQVRVKAMYALSALLNNCAEAQAAFIRAGGAEALLAILSREERANEPKMVRKALVLATDLLREQRGRREAAEQADGGFNAFDSDGPLVVTADGGTRRMSAAEMAQEVGRRAGMEEGSGVHGEEEANANRNAEGLPDIAEAEMLLTHWRNASELCAAVLHCFSVEEVDAHEKAVLAVEQLLESGLLHALIAKHPAGTRTSLAAGGCSLRTLQEELTRYVRKCDSLQADPPAEDGDDTERVGVGSCDDLGAVANRLRRQLGEMERDAQLERQV